MSQDKIFDYNLESCALEDLFEKQQCPMNIADTQPEDAVETQKKEQQLAGGLELDLEQLQRRQSIVLESAKKQVAVLENLLKTVKPGWVLESGQPLAGAGAGAAAPQAYRFKDIYEQKKQQLLQQKLNEEREQRQFHSRPMPNFRQVHQQLLNRPIVHRITCPITPNVLKRRQRVEQQLQQRGTEQLQQQQREPRSKPFKAASLCTDNSNINGSSVPCKPFRFSTELRAEQRKRFNTLTQELQENRRRQQEEQRQRLEQQQYQKLRQLATFRARPNPFRAHLIASPPVE